MSSSLIIAPMAPFCAWMPTCLPFAGCYFPPRLRLFCCALGAGATGAAARRYTPKFAVADGVGEPIEEMAAVLEALAAAKKLAARNAGLVVAQPTWTEKQAGIFEPPPADEEAVATTLGLLLNCINSGLYMANYNLARRLARASRPPARRAQALFYKEPSGPRAPARACGLRCGGALPGL